MKKTERSAVLGFLLMLVVAMAVMQLGCKPASSAERTAASIKERLAIVERSSAIEPFSSEVVDYTFTVVFSYHQDIPDFQKVILRRSRPGTQENSYFAGLASMSEQFRPGDEVLVFVVNYVMNDNGFAHRFLLVRKKE